MNPNTLVAHFLFVLMWHANWADARAPGEVTSSDIAQVLPSFELLSYDGTWTVGQMTGTGVAVWDNGLSYSGSWHNGIPSGEGRLE